MEINSFDYEKAKLKDKRAYWGYYFSLIRMKHILIFTFFQLRDHNSQAIKIYIFFLTFAINYLVSAMFYSEDTMHKIYVDEGSFDFTYQLPQMFYSFIISTALKTILNILGLYEEDIIEYKFNNNNNLNEKRKLLFKIRYKIFLFFIITNILLGFFWIYLGCFCAIYKNTQIILVEDTLISFLLSLVYPFGIYFLPGIFRIPSLKDTKNNRICLYEISKIIQLI